LLLLLLSRAADWQDSANMLLWFSAGFFSFSPTPGFYFIYLLVLFVQGIFLLLAEWDGKSLL